MLNEIIVRQGLTTSNSGAILVNRKGGLVMGQAAISARVDIEDKKDFEKFCKETGLTVTTAINIFVKAVLREQRIPFEVETDPFYSEENMARLRDAIKEYEAGHYTEHELIEV